MKGLWKRIGSVLLSVCCALCFSIVGIKWLLDARASGGTDRFTLVLAWIWLIGAVIWTIRAFREYRGLPKPERQVADAAVNALLCMATSILSLRQSGIGRLAGLVWAVAAIAWIAHTVRRYREQQENDHIEL